VTVLGSAPPGVTATPPPPLHHGRRRRARNRSLWVLSALALALVVIPVVWIILGVVARSVAHWQWRALVTYPAGNGGGLLNAIEGTLVLVLGVLVLAGGVGVAGGVYLAEYCGEGRGQFLRGASEVLSGVPSIVIGYVGFISLVVYLHWGNSLYAGMIALSILVVPYVTKMTEVALRNVPTSYREGGEALGMRTGYVLRKLVLRPALPGIATGLVLAVAISIGETAPLLYTAGYSSRGPTFSLHTSPVGYLTYVVWTDYNQPFASSHDLANMAATLLITLVVLLILGTRIIVATTQRFSPDRPQRVGRAPK